MIFKKPDLGQNLSGNARFYNRYENNAGTLDSIRARDLDQGEEEEEGEAGKSGLNLINK